LKESGGWLKSVFVSGNEISDSGFAQKHCAQNMVVDSQRWYQPDASIPALPWSGQDINLIDFQCRITGSYLEKIFSGEMTTWAEYRFIEGYMHDSGQYQRMFYILT
jgi:hypothetical protein